MKIRHLTIIFICLLFLAACTEEKRERPVTQSAPGTVKSVSGSSPEVILRPFLPTIDSRITAEVKNVAGSANIEVQWFVNGEITSQENTYIFHPDKLKKGDVVQAKVIYDGNEYFSNKVILTDIPPVIHSGKILPENPECTDTLVVEVTAIDRDRDNITYSYRWYVNENQEGQLPYLEGVFKRGDQVSVDIVPFDNEEYGKLFTARTVITNSPPEISPELINESLKDDLYKVQVSASDPDGDTLTYSLVDAPEGIEIDQTGLITWDKVGPEKKGKHDIKVLVEDGHDAEAHLSFSLNIGYELVPSKKEEETEGS